MTRPVARLRPYGLALLCTAGAVASRWLLDPVLGDDLPLITAFAFAAFAVWLAGWAPALCMALASFLALNWLFVAPRHELALGDATFWWALFAYGLGVLPVIAIGEAMRRARLRAREGEEELRALAERLRLAMAAGGMGAWEVDFRAGTLVWDARQHEIFDRPLDDPPRSLDEFYALVHPEDLAPIRRAYADAAGRPIGRFSVEFRITRRNGEMRWIAGQATTIADETGRLERVVGINYDVTERREAEARLQSFAQELEREVASRTEQLVRSEEQLRAMAADLTLAEQRERQRFATELHDHLQQLLVLCKLKLGRARHLAAAVPELMALNSEVDETLTRALSYSRSLVAELSPPVLREFGFSSALAWLGDWMQSLDLQVTVHVNEQEPIELPEAQAVLLFQSVRELLINAAKYAGTGRATVRLERPDGYLRVTVSDEGSGFDPAAAAAAAAAGGSSSAKFGLFSIRERMKTLGGALHIESARGQGTRATLTLPFVHEPASRPQPLAPRAAKAHEPGARGSPAADRSARVSVLLVDDHAVVREGLRSVLSEHTDVEVVGEALDGAEAVACVERLHPSIVVMDINMPRKNGIEATAEITSRWPDVAVIGLSVNADRENQEAMTRAGAALLLPKEAAVDDLYRSIQRLLNR